MSLNKTHARSGATASETKPLNTTLADLADMEGCAVLDRVDGFLARFVAYPSEHARHAHTLWLAHTHRMDAWESTPRLAFMSPEKRTGKTRALEVSQYLVPRGVFVSQATTGYVLARVSQIPTPTLLYDEIDSVYGTNAKGNEDLRAVLNSGHRRGAKAGRGSWDRGALSPRDYPSYCAVALAGIGKLPETIADRAVIIPMQRRKPNEHIEPWRDRVNGPDAKELGNQLARWMGSATLTWPENMPVTDRVADVWEALIMVADAAGGHWPANAREAAKAMGSGTNETDGPGVQLLNDLRELFGDKDRMGSADIVDALVKLPDSPWRHYHSNGHPLTTRELSRLLKRYGVNSRDVWIGGRSVKGYLADDLIDAWERYLPPPSESARSARRARQQVTGPDDIAETSPIADTGDDGLPQGDPIELHSDASSWWGCKQFGREGCSVHSPHMSALRKI